MAFSAEQLNIIVSARTKELEKQLDRATSKVKRFERQTKSDLGRASKSFAALAVAARRILPALGAAVVVQNIKRVTAQMDTIGKKADQIGLTTDALQELTYVAEGAGVSQEKFTSSMERFSKRLGEATLGVGAASKMLKTMGLDANELTQIPLDQALGEVADKMSQIEDPTQRAAAAAAIFGREGVAMVNMMREGSDGLDRMRQAANDAGAVIDEKLIREAEEAQTKLDAASRVINAQLAIGLSNLTPLLVGAAEGFAGLAKRVGEFLSESEPVDQTMMQLIGDVNYLKSILGEGVTLDQIVDPAGQEVLRDLEDSLIGIGVEAFEAATAIQTQITQLENLSRAGQISEEKSEDLRAKLQALKSQLDEMATESFIDLNTQEAVTKLEQLEQDAIDVATQLAAVDGARFGRLTENLFGLRNVLDTVFKAAQRAAAAIPGARVVTKRPTGPGQGTEPPGVAYYPPPPPDTDTDPDPDEGTLTPAVNGGGGGGGDPYAKLKSDLESLREYLDEYRMSETEAQIAEFETRQQLLDEALNNELLTQEEYNRLKEENQRQHSDKIADIIAAERAVRLGEMSSMFSALADIAEQGGKKTLKAQAALSAAATMIAAYENAVTAAAKAQTIPGKIAAYAGFLAQGLAAVNQIKSIGNSGRATSGGGAAAGAGAAAAPQVSRNVAIQLTGGDMYSRDQVIRLINGINEAVEDGAVVRLV